MSVEQEWLEDEELLEELSEEDLEILGEGIEPQHECTQCFKKYRTLREAQDCELRHSQKQEELAEKVIEEERMAEETPEKLSETDMKGIKEQIYQDTRKMFSAELRSKTMSPKEKEHLEDQIKRLASARFIEAWTRAKEKERGKGELLAKYKDRLMKYAVQLGNRTCPVDLKAFPSIDEAMAHFRTHITDFKTYTELWRIFNNEMTTSSLDCNEEELVSLCPIEVFESHQIEELSKYTGQTSWDRLTELYRKEALRKEGDRIFIETFREKQKRENEENQ